MIFITKLLEVEGISLLKLQITGMAEPLPITGIFWAFCWFKDDNDCDDDDVDGEFEEIEVETNDVVVPVLLPDVEFFVILILILFTPIFVDVCVSCISTLPSIDATKLSLPCVDDIECGTYSSLKNLKKIIKKF